MKKFIVKTDVPYFRREQFEMATINGRETVVMKICKDDFLSESFMFSLYSMGLDAIPYEKTDTERKYLCAAGDRFYIVSERGTKGFETEFAYFMAEINTADGDEITVSISPVEDAELTGAIYEKFIENEFSVADSFNEKNLLGGCSHSNPISLKQIKMIEDSEFIRLPYKGKQRKIPAILNIDDKLHDKLHLCYTNEYIHLDTGENVSGEAPVGSLLYRRDNNIRNMVEVVKLINYAHDFNADFWAVVEVIYSYPADADAIKAAHPDFFERECAADTILEKRELLEYAKDLPYIREEFRIGDGIIHIPVDVTAAEISIPVGEFHFVVGQNYGYGHLNTRAKGRLRLNDKPVLCSLIEVNRRFKLLYYRTVGFVKCGDGYYAELSFQRQSKFMDSLDADRLNFKDIDWEERVMDKAALICAGYLMFREMIAPVVIDKDDTGTNITEE